MILEVIKIRPYKKSKTEGVYLMIEMKDIKTGDWYKTYLVPGYRNYNMWRTKARLSNQLHFFNLKMVSENIIDADSVPILLIGRQKYKDNEKELRELFKLGTFG